MKCNCIRIVTVVFGLVAFGLVAFGLGSAFVGAGNSAPEGAMSAAEGSDTSSPPPRSPLRVSTIDFQDTADGSGKLTLAGVALPGSELFLFLDDEPFATVMPDGGGKWSYEGVLTLGDGRHTLRADQYDKANEMLAARAMVTIQRAKPGEGGAAPAPAPTTPSP
jgi:hypothetical protein